VFLAGLGGHVRGDGDGLLGAAGREVLRRGQDLRPVAGERHGRRAERAADLAHGGGALHPVVAVGVVAGDPAELVAGGLGCLLVMCADLAGGGAAGLRAEF
jgi:hypothetical protein